MDRRTSPVLLHNRSGADIPPTQRRLDIGGICILGASAGNFLLPHPSRNAPFWKQNNGIRRCIGELITRIFVLARELACQHRSRDCRRGGVALPHPCERGKIRCAVEDLLRRVRSSDRVEKEPPEPSRSRTELRTPTTVRVQRQVTTAPQRPTGIGPVQTRRTAGRRRSVHQPSVREANAEAYEPPRRAGQRSGDPDQGDGRRSARGVPRPSTHHIHDGTNGGIARRPHRLRISPSAAGADETCKLVHRAARGHPNRSNDFGERPRADAQTGEEIRWPR